MFCIRKDNIDCTFGKISLRTKQLECVLGGFIP